MILKDSRPDAPSARSASVKQRTIVGDWAHTPHGNLSAQQPSLSKSSQPRSFNGTAVGGIVGAGIDIPLTHNVFLRGEYDFSFFGKKTFNYCGVGCLLQHTAQAHDFRVGIGMKF